MFGQTVKSKMVVDKNDVNQGVQTPSGAPGQPV